MCTFFNSAGFQSVVRGQEAKISNERSSIVFDIRVI